jgi:hypothetical protein
MVGRGREPSPANRNGNPRPSSTKKGTQAHQPEKGTRRSPRTEDQKGALGVMGPALLSAKVSLRSRR